MRLSSTLIYLCIFLLCNAQPYVNVRTFSIRDGLAANLISGMEQTPDGLMWFPTWNGLCCYDGYTFTTYRGNPHSLSSNRIISCKSDRQGHIWCITYDRNGCDSIIDYLDGQGLRKYNNNGVDQTRYVYDDKGYIIEAKSCNCVGDPIIDNWGNCGFSVTYDHQKGFRSQVYRDKEWIPMRMPATRADIEQTFIRCDYQQDHWGRDSVATYLTADGKPDATLAGIHQIHYKYSDDGILISKTYYDINLNVFEPKKQ